MTDITRDQMIEFCDLQIKNGKHCVEEEYYFAAMRAALSEQPNTTERESVTEGESSLTGGLPNQSQDVAPCGDMKTAKEWFWNTTEDGTFNGPYATKNDALYDAIHGYEVFGDEETDCIFLIDGNCYPNPDYDSEYPQDDDNYPENIRGEISEFTKTQALDWVLSHIDKLIQTNAQQSKPLPKEATEVVSNLLESAEDAGLHYKLHPNDGCMIKARAFLEKVKS